MNLSDLKRFIMKNSKKTLPFVIALSWMTALSGCASYAIVSPPRLQDRTLELDNLSSMYYYTYDVCVEEGWFGRCKKKEYRKEFYDPNDPVVLKMLKDMDFVLSKRILP